MTNAAQDVVLAGRDRPANENSEKVDAIEVTPEMVAAGLKEFLESGRLFTDYEASSDRLVVRRIFLAMWDSRSRGMFPTAG
jgi:hypothetical protein